MSESFAPRAEFNIAQEQPLAGVENRAAETAVRGLTSLFARTGGSGGSGGATQENALNAAYIDEMDKVKSMEDAGEYTRAAIYRQKIDRNFIAAGGDLNDASLGAAIKARTGYELEHFAIDPVDQRNAYLDSHGDAEMVYQGLIANGMNPDVAREETRRVIGDRLADQQTLAAAQDRDPAWWERTGRHAFENNLDYVVDNISGMAAQGIATGVQFDSQSVQELRVAWASEKAQTMAALPAYLTDDQRRAISDRFDAVDSQISALESVAGNDAFMTVFRDRIANRGDKTHSQVMNEMLLELETKGSTLSAITGGNVGNARLFIENVLEASAEGGAIKADRDFLTALADPDRNLIEGMQIVPQEEAAALYPEYNPKDRGVAVKDAETLARAGHSVQVHELQTKDVAYAYADTVLGMATAVNNIGSNGELLTPASMKRIMGDTDSFSQKMQFLAEYHPDVYAQVAPQLANALNGQAMVAQRAVESWMQNGKAYGYQLDLIYDPTTKNYYATNEGFTTHMRQVLGEREFAANYKEGKGLVYRKGDRWADDNFFSTIESGRTARDALSTFGVATPPERGGRPEVTLPAPHDVFMDEIDRTEGGGDYDALLNFTNRKGPFMGVKVSEMTLGELYEFSDGSYAAYSRQQLGYKATPMGRYQFVGTTLKDVAKQMDLPDDTVFTAEIQDQMFGYYVNQVLSTQSTMGGKMAAMRSTWAGFRNTSDKKLRQMITDYEAGFGLWAEEQESAASAARSLDNIRSSVAFEDANDPRKGIYAPDRPKGPEVLSESPEMGVSDLSVGDEPEGLDGFSDSSPASSETPGLNELIDPSSVPSYDPSTPVHEFKFSEGEIDTDSMNDGDYVVDTEKREVYTVQDGILDVADEELAQVVLQEHVDTNQGPSTRGGQRGKLMGEATGQGPSSRGGQRGSLMDDPTGPNTRGGERGAKAQTVDFDQEQIVEFSSKVWDVNPKELQNGAWLLDTTSDAVWHMEGGQPIRMDDDVAAKIRTYAKTRKSRLGTAQDFQSSPEVREHVRKLVSSRQKALLDRAGISLDEVHYYSTLEMAEIAFKRGDIEAGTPVVIRTGQVYFTE